MKYYSTLKTNELSSHREMWKNLKCTGLSGRSHTENDTYCIISIPSHSGTGKTVRVKNTVVAGGCL